MNGYLVGVDLGQAHDYSTIAVVERAELRGEWDAAQYAWRKVTALRLRALQRIALGTPYPDVAARVAEVTHSRAMADGQRYLAVDGTGVGRPVIDLLKRARPTALLLPVLVTAGERQTRSGDYYHVPKRDLMVGLQVLFQQGGLQISRGLEFGPELVQELQGMEVRLTGSGREQYAVWRSGSHDDLVFAVALACWAAGTAYPERGNGYWTNRREAEAAKVFRSAVQERVR